MGSLRRGGRSVARRAAGAGAGAGAGRGIAGSTRWKRRAWTLQTWTTTTPTTTTSTRAGRTPSGEYAPQLAWVRCCWVDVSCEISCDVSRSCHALTMRGNRSVACRLLIVFSLSLPPPSPSDPPILPSSPPRQRIEGPAAGAYPVTDAQYAYLAEQQSALDALNNYGGAAPGV
eukprot:1452565-Rhodomonas_salina.2